MKKKGKFSYSTGGNIGSVAGGLAGNLIPIPGVGPALGATLGGLVGNGIESLLTQQQSRPLTPADVNMAGKGMSYQNGGMMLPVPGARGEFVGPKHSQGGINVAGKEVEGGETTDVALGSQYVFSKKLKVPGTTLSFADMHKKLIKGGAGQDQIENLARMQEKARKSADPNKLDLGGTLKSFLPYVGDAINITRGLLPSRQITPDLIPKTNVEKLQSLKLDTSPQENQILATQRAINDTTTSRGTRLSAHARTLEALNGLQTQKRNFETQNQKEAIGLSNAIDSQNVQIKNNARIDNLNRKDARENVLAEGIAGISRTTQALNREKNQRAMDILGTMVGVQNMDPVDLKNMLDSLKELLPSDIYAVLRTHVQNGEIGKARELVNQALPTMPDSSLESVVSLPQSVPGARVREPIINDGVSSVFDRYYNR